MADMLPKVPKSPLPIGVQGSSINPLYTKRFIKVYSVSESEAHQLSSINSTATYRYSFGSFFGSAAIGIYTNSIFYDKFTDMGIIALRFIMPILIVIAVACFTFGFLATRQRNQLWSDIKRNSSDVI